MANYQKLAQAKLNEWKYVQKSSNARLASLTEDTQQKFDIVEVIDGKEVKVDWKWLKKPVDINKDELWFECEKHSSSEADRLRYVWKVEDGSWHGLDFSKDAVKSVCEKKPIVLGKESGDKLQFFKVDELPEGSWHEVDYKDYGFVDYDEVQDVISSNAWPVELYNILSSNMREYVDPKGYVSLKAYKQKMEEQNGKQH